MSDLVIGIDLGTTYSGAAYIDESGFVHDSIIVVKILHLSCSY